MAIDVTTEPASPSVGDGITVTVTGPVPVRARVQISLAGKVHETSPAFEQGENPEGLNPSSYTLAVDATGGTFTLTVHGNVTAAIAFGANAAAVKAAIDAVLVAGETCTVTGTTTKTITFAPSTSAISLTAQSGSLTGNTHTATVTAVTTGNTQAESASGPFKFGPVFLPDDGTHVIDVVADATGSGHTAGDSLLSAPVNLVVTA